MTRFSDDQVHRDPHRAALARTALTCVMIYVAAAIAGWVCVGALAAMVLAW